MMINVYRVSSFTSYSVFKDIVKRHDLYILVEKQVCLGVVL
jgi:hypothetical protein